MIADAIALQKNNPVDHLKINDSILIEITDSNSSYYSGEDTVAAIFVKYTTDAIFKAMQQNKQNKQLNPVKGV